MSNENHKCPKCGEESPADAVMCWACYTPLGAGRASAPVPEAETSTGDKVKRELSDAVPYVAIVASTVSGWLPRRMRLPVLGASASALFGPMLIDILKNRFAKDKTDDARNREGEKSPSVRIAETLLYYAWRDKATATRIEERGRGIRVSYQIENEWREQMKIPLYAWKPLRQQLLRYARQGEFKLESSEYESGNHRSSLKLTGFRAQLETDAQGETLQFQFESAPLEAATGALRFDDLPDVQCLQCREENAPDAVWCWNCGADLREQNSARDRKHSILSALFFVGFAVLSSSGWWPRRARFPVASAGALVFVAPFAFDKWDERAKRRREDDYEKRGVTQMWEAPAIGLVNDILLRAIQEKLPAIRLQNRGNVVVSYEIDEQRQQDKILPSWTWLTMRTDLLKRAREKVTCGGREYRFRSELNVDVSGETLVLRFDGAL